MDDQRTDPTASGVRFRKLRIAWSVFWGLAAVLWIVLWMRSYGWRESLGVTKRTALVTGDGELSITTARRNYGAFARPGHFDRQPASVASTFWRGKRSWNLYAIYGADIGTKYSCVVIKIPLLVVAFGFASASFWFRWRFSLRTLLITMTMVAAALGLIVYMAG